MFYDHALIMFNQLEPVPTSTNQESCHINTIQHNIISVECPQATTSFQVIVQLGEGKLYVNRTQPGQTSTSVEVEESGEFLVSVIPIIEGRGITSSSEAYRSVVIVEGSGMLVWIIAVAVCH